MSLFPHLYLSGENKRIFPAGRIKRDYRHIKQQNAQLLELAISILSLWKRVAQAGLKMTEDLELRILLPPFLECWGCRHVPSHSVLCGATY